MIYLRAFLLTLCLTLAGCASYVDLISNSKGKYGAENMGASGNTLTSAEAIAQPNPLGISGTVNTRDADSLYQSLDAMVGPLGQKEKLAFMEAFFRVALLERCDIVGQFGTSGNSITGGRNSFRSCVSSARTSVWSHGPAEAYVADKRMDDNPAYVASNAFGSWTGGETQRGSYVNFINLYGDVMDGKSADYIFQRNRDIMNGTAVSFR